MSCLYPRHAWLQPQGRPSFRPPSWLPVDEAVRLPSHVMLPCGRCLYCRTKRARDWATRCYHEALTSEASCFVTLTYAPEHLPKGGTLVKRDLQLFIKRLRKAIAPVKIRFFACGEYGAHLSRPHYHVLVFGWRPPDLVLWCTSRKSCTLYRSALVERLWPLGYSTVGDVTIRSCGYVARYCLKKVYRCPDYYDGRLPEFTACSTRPAIGRRWLETCSGPTYPDDFVVVDGVKRKPPRYYDKFLELTNPVLFDMVKANRRISALATPEDERLRRARVKDELLAGQLSTVWSRDYED